jgi:signal transduction histidine kinase
MNDAQNLTQSRRLNLILNALRDIGKLIVTQTDKQVLLNGICDILVEKRGYFNAWIGLLDADNTLLMTAHAGIGNKFSRMRDQIAEKQFPICVKKTLTTHRVFSVIDPVVGCRDCILAENYAGRGAMAVRLAHHDKSYGFMVLSVSKELSIDDNEKALVKEIADDIAFGLYRFDLETSQKESKKRFETLIANSLNCISIIQDHKIVYQNPGLRKVHQMITQAFVPPDFNNVFADDKKKLTRAYQRLNRGKTLNIDEDFRYYPHGFKKEEVRIRWAKISARKINYFGTESILTNMMDITDSMEMENFLRIQDKMTSLGRVTAGIAHEIRNPLSGIYVYLKALKKIYNNMGDIDNVLSIIKKIENASGKIESIIKRVMDFSRPGRPQMVLSNINTTLDEVTKLTAVTLRKNNIRFVKHLDPDVPDCWNEPHLIEQVVLNLITNAAEAMKEVVKDKSIELKTAVSNNRISISIKDTGPGIPSASQTKIFDPFFTTKSNSSGIGLSICHRIITDHGGSLKLNTNHTTGAEFIIELPVDHQPEE